MTTMSLIVTYFALLSLLLMYTATAFSTRYGVQSRTVILQQSSRYIIQTNTELRSSTRSTAENNHNDDSSSHFLLQEFSIASGEVINPYEILKVSRKSTRDEIRASYIKQSRRYHPDGFRNNKSNNILPGSCNNLDDVREQWERIKLSYEILSNPKTRRRYDRHDVLSDPNAAMQRAAMNAAVDGITNVGKGIFNIGSFAIRAIAKGTNDSNVQRVD